MMFKNNIRNSQIDYDHDSDNQKQHDLIFSLEMIHSVETDNNKFLASV